jgi:hypothetical protein
MHCLGEAEQFVASMVNRFLSQACYIVGIIDFCVARNPIASKSIAISWHAYSPASSS